jgi:hypothetical protein
VPLREAADGDEADNAEASDDTTDDPDAAAGTS